MIVLVLIEDTLRIVIAVDGLAGSGKTTLARHLSQETGFIHLNTGLLYRGVGWLAIKAQLSGEPDQAFYNDLVRKHRLELVVDRDRVSRLKIDGVIRGDELHDPQVSEYASKCAPHESVRSALMDAQRGAFIGYPMVAEGRDMGTVVFPDAQLKFFITADPGVRAARRMAQLEAQRGGLSEAERLALKSQLEQEITERDRRDQERPISPTKPAQDAIILDNSAKTLTEMVKAMYDAASNRGLLNR